MGLGSSKPDAATEKLAITSKRRCSAFASALEGCKKANPAGAATICKNLEIKLVTCWAEDHCKDLAEEHAR